MTHILFTEQFTFGGRVIVGIFFAVLCVMLLNFALKMFEMGYVLRNKKPFYVYTPFFLKKLSPVQKRIMVNQFKFYQKLKPKHQRYFEHRVASFISDKRFFGREELVVTDEMKVLISATAVMLTFGFRDFYIGLIDKIFIYPDEFYSLTNENYHKGEFNPKLETLVLSWKDFKKGFENDTDKINLGIHEFAHAIHLNSIKERDVSSTIFSDSFKELTELLANEESLRKSLIESRYFRDYAYTNQYEFVAVIIETFIESPSEFRAQFPEIYNKTKQMLNFNFAGY
ncbi:zinc-dependent peptidase [Subsaxibacter sp. CAU 1640]|uniref:zinc-dependent peptidase n=1 Tax=Subsaxibacter sp. CAU 1640 TaxID=2933271 RepID=UPI00200548A2|nr:zinc-dependent peptidase [Subsaxibacter sp. CAU 1640]MCK7590247.1 zinc-dependent peptidase [Subsaxibacter sp. CAU 1640]